MNGGGEEDESELHGRNQTFGFGMTTSLFLLRIDLKTPIYIYLKVERRELFPWHTSEAFDGCNGAVPSMRNVNVSKSVPAIRDRGHESYVFECHEGVTHWYIFCSPQLPIYLFRRGVDGSRFDSPTSCCLVVIIGILLLVRDLFYLSFRRKKTETESSDDERVLLSSATKMLHRLTTQSRKEISNAQKTELALNIPTP